MSGVAQATALVRLVHVASGNVVEAWPVDAKEMLACGDHVRESEWVAPVAEAEAVVDAEAPAAEKRKR